MQKIFIPALVIPFLASCGGGLAGLPGGGTTGTGGTGGTPVSGGSVTQSIDRVSNLGGSFVGGEFVPTTAKYDGKSTYVIKAWADLPVYSDGLVQFRIASGDDGKSFAAAGYDFNGNVLGSYLSSASAPPTSGDVTYVGDYTGELFGAFSGALDPITGTATVMVDFSRDVFIANIENRDNPYPSSGYDLDQLEAPVTFSGYVTDRVLTGAHSDGDSNGRMDAIAYSDGMVGTVELLHFDASTYTGTDIPEVGTFTAEQQ